MGLKLAAQPAEYAPLSELDQNSSKEKYIQTSITDWNLHHLTKSFNESFQEVFFFFAGILRSPIGDYRVFCLKRSP